MKQLFESATLKLTAWYLAILMSISLLFSFIIFQISTNEIRVRLGVFETHLIEQDSLFIPPPDARAQEVQQARINLFVALAYANLAIAVLGGIVSYIAARRTLEPLEKLHEAQSRFTSDASHELRTPLAVMKSELEVALRSGALSKAEMHELLESNLEEVNRLATLSETLLRLSRHEYSKLEMKPVNLADVIKTAAKAHKLPKKRLSIELPKRRVLVTGNGDSLSELVMILLDNALRYSPDDSQVTLSLATKKDGAQFQITNTGPGIHEDDLPHVFDRFYRADKSRTGGTETGFGLGLSLAKKIADLHGANITIESEPGEITSATVLFEKA